MSKLREFVVSNCEKNFLLKCLKEHKRLDHRSFSEFRDVNIEFGKDYGCCYVSLGKTKVLAQVSCEIQVPKSSRPSEGLLYINIELNPIAAPNFDPTSKNDLFTQLNRTLEKCIKDSKAIDLESLCIKMNEKAWAIRVDINVLNHEGNILDCASIAALSALCHFRRPDISCDGEEFVVLRYDQKDPIPLVIHHHPVCITYSIFERGEFILADPTLLEEGVADAFLNVGMNAYRELCGLHLGGKAELTPDVVIKITQMAGARAAIVVDQIKKAVELDNEKRKNKETIGFHTTINKTKEIVENLESCFDLWKTVPKKMKNENHSMEVDASPVPVKTEHTVCDIQSKGDGSAVLIPEEYEEVKDDWGESSEEELDQDVVEIPRKIQTISLVESDSEEEATVVLNAKKKTKNKKKAM